ncbi:MAG: hypothetical protein PPP56_05920 [Longimonas sp.]|uniref:hypothetical protein n=1 Tax=Longimonas sp. TaxID=2039626 RepID=UPI003344D5B5
MMRIPCRILSAFPLFALLLAFTACNSVDDNGADNGNGFVLDVGSFEATVDDSGETLDLSGGAAFGLKPSPSGGEEFVLYMLDGERPPEEERSETNRSWTTIDIEGREGVVPEEGDYDFEEGGTVPYYQNSMNSYELGRFIGGGPGTFTITNANEDVLEGTFSFEDPHGGETRVENGSFTAERVDDIETVRCRPDCDE